MLIYILRRLAIGCLTLLLITFVIYGLIRSMPGTALTLDMAEVDPSRQISPEDLERLKAIYGLDKPWYQAYFVWLGNLLRLDMGHSIAYKQPVLQIISDHIGPTLLLSGASLFLTYLLSIPMGLFATVRSGRFDERALSVILYMLYSLPSYVAALFLLILFYVKLEGTGFQLPAGGLYSSDYEELSLVGKAFDRLRHLALPLVCYTYGGLAYFSRFVKANMEEVIRQDYIRTARAKGAGPARVIWHHAFRNTLVPFVTLVGLTLPSLVSGAIILEFIFSWPGMGQLFLESLTRRDYPTIMGLTLVFSMLTLVAQLIADLLYGVVDPRVSYT